MKKFTDISLPYVDDNTPREELDEATRMPMSAPIVKVDPDEWDKVVQRMKDKEKKRREK